MGNDLLIMMLILALVAGYVLIAVFDKFAGKKLSKRSRFLKKPADPRLDMPEEAFQGEPADKLPERRPSAQNWSPEDNPAEDWAENGGVMKCEDADSPLPKQ